MSGVLSSGCIKNFPANVERVMQVFKAAHKKIVEIRVSIRNKPSISQTEMTT